MSKFNAIYKECKKCKKCRLRENATQVVPGEGKEDAEIMFIGEGPGANEDKEGIPFCGAAGKYLDELLKTINVKREDVFITNMVRCRPPGNRDPKDDEIKACKYWTNEFIKVIQPKVFVLLGRFAMAKFFPNLQISKVHGNAYRKWGRVFVIMYHPAVALYNASYKEILEEDVKILRRILNGEDDSIEDLGSERDEIKEKLENSREKDSKNQLSFGLNNRM